MATIDATREPLRRRTRFRTSLVALSALIAIGATAIILVLSGANHAMRSHAPIADAQPWPDTPLTAVTSAAHAGSAPIADAQPWPDTPLTAVTSAAHAPSAPDPTTHAPIRVKHAGRNTPPTLASVLSSLTPQQRQYVLGIASLSPAQLAAAFGTGQVSSS
jgi:hypothetical protein